jgi:hypothetical protein
VRRREGYAFPQGILEEGISMSPRALGPAVLAAAILFSNAPAAEKPPAIPAGSTLRVRLGTTLTDKTNKTGDPFTGEVTDAIVVNGKEVIAQYSTVNGHLAFVKPSGRVRGKAEMRIVIDNITTPDNVVYPLSSILEDAQGGVCGDTTVIGKNSKANEEGTITGCGKSKKQAVKGAAIAAGIGAAAGATVGMAGRGGCDYYGYCYPQQGPGIGTSIGYGAGIGAGTALIYNLFKHEKHIVLVEGMHLTFTVNRTTAADESAKPSPN